jgi:hypothetical protein
MMEAEYMAVAAAAHEALRMNKLIETFRFKIVAMPMLIRTDSKSALALVRNPVVFKVQTFWRLSPFL